ncbi:MAG TPA: DUF882 domain-containing protein [Kofleriaceae bacterium]|nr:DUF882 domain-containing protein [Kofleriaceae bacterium]
MIRPALAVVILCALPTAAAAGPPASANADAIPAPTADPVPAEPEVLSKKEAYVRAKAASEPSAKARAALERTLAKRIGKPPERVITVFNGWTHEVMVLPAAGPAKIDQDQANHFLHCRFTNKKADMAGALLPTALQAARHFKSDRIVVVSAFRSPKYNLMLRKKGREVSRNSQHTHGKALDFRLDGVSATKLRDWARNLGLGGVGYYGKSAFVHVDTAAVRYWVGE